MTSTKVIKCFSSVNRHIHVVLVDQQHVTEGIDVGVPELKNSLSMHEECVQYDLKKDDLLLSALISQKI